MKRYPRPHDIGIWNGNMVDALDPKPEDFDIPMLAAALSKICHWNGRCEGFFSIAAHSIMVAVQCPPHLRLAGLLHDAPEVFLTDIPSPLKSLLPDYKVVEERFESVMTKAFGLPDGWAKDPALKLADIMVLYKEASVLMTGCDWAKWPQFDHLTADQRAEALSWNLLGAIGRASYFMGGNYDFQYDEILFRDYFLRFRKC